MKSQNKGEFDYLYSKVILRNGEKDAYNDEQKFKGEYININDIGLFKLYYKSG
jgi:hypothetical protein